MNPARGPVRTEHTHAIGRAAAVALLALVLGLLPRPTAGQTVNGVLLDTETGIPIGLGLVMMFTEAGDSVTATITNEDGFFSITSPEPGSFILLAAGLGYRETPAGVFDLDAGGVMTVRYGLRPEPLRIDELVVSLTRPALPHRLVRNGFVRRLQRGLGWYVTPHDIEESPATSTEQLLAHVPGVRIGTIARTRTFDVDGDPVATIMPRPDIGETIQIRSPNGGWCTPTIFVDGIPTTMNQNPASSTVGLTLSTLAPLQTVEAIEVYRRAAEIPVEYSFSSAGENGLCGALVVWTRSR